MNSPRTRRFLTYALGLLAVLVLAGVPAWGAQSGCHFPAAAQAGGTGMGGTGSIAAGTGMGGTGTVAAGTGMGGTGIRPAVAGRVLFSQGTAKALGKSGSRVLVKGSPICVGETIVTASASQVQIRMADGGMISIRPSTRMKIDVFRFDGKEDGTEKSVITLLRGGFRALTGMVGHTHKKNYSIRTPFAVIGIRGTDHEPMFIPNPAPGQKAVGTPGTYDKVNSGGVVIRNAEGSVDVKPDHVGFVPNDPTSVPVLLKEMPKFYRPSSRAERANGARRHGESEISRGRHEQERAGEHGESRRIHVPEPYSDELKSHDMRSPEMQMPEAPESPGVDD